MARIPFPQSTVRQAPKVRTSKTHSGNSRSAKEPPRSSRTRQSSLLLSTTAQLRGAERTVQQDAQRRARRRRQAVRQLRQVEATMKRVQLPQLDNIRLSLPTGLRLSHWQPSKIASLLLLVGVVALFTWIHSDAQWFVYRENVTFEQLTYADADELYQQIGIDSWNIFWLSSSAIRERLVALPTVADAQVTVQLPNQVTVTIQEEQPVALWVTQEGNWWLLPDGTALPEPEQFQATLLQIIDPQQEAKAWGDATGAKVDAHVLQSALKLSNYLPEVSQIYFNQGYGLNFHLPGSNSWIYWGDGLEMEKKYRNVAAVQSYLRTADSQPQIIDVRFEKPVLK
ncbi:MAG: FtsQ-type POTRA domain-containing protein [Caldilineaceae bacterium]